MTPGYPSASVRDVTLAARSATWCARAVPWIILPTALWRLPFAFGFDMLVTHVVWGPMLLAITFDYWRRHRSAATRP